MAEQEDFDPYRKWLGIPAAELPPSLYRLLGLVDFESDPDVISNAADRCMAHVRTFQTGSRGALSQRLLNELAQARNCLLDVQRRQAYDLALRRQRVAAPPPVAAGVMQAGPMAPVAVMPIPMAASATGLLDTPLMAGPRSQGSVSSRVRRKSSPVPMLLGLVAVIVVGGVGTIVWKNAQRDKALVEKKPAAVVVPEPPKSYVVKRTRSDGDVVSNALTPDAEAEAGEGTNRQSGGGAPVIDVRSSSDPRNRRERPDPTNAAEALEEARIAMATGNPARAKRMLTAAESFSPNEEQAERIVILEKLQGYLQNFYRALASGAEKLEPGRNFLIDLGSRQVPVTFVDFERQNGRRLVFESEGKRMAYRLDTLPSNWAMPIARPMLDANSPGARLAMATFLALATNGDRELAQQMWRALISEGVADPSLARELGLQLPEGIAKSSNVPAEMKPEMPEKKPETAPKPGDLMPVPTGTELAEAKRAFREEYRQQVSDAKNAADKAALSDTLVTKAAETTDNPALRFVLMQEAIDLRVEEGNATEFVKLIDTLGGEYQLDMLAAKAEALGKASADATDAEQAEAIYLVTSEIYVTAKELQRYDVAERLARSAAKCAERVQAREAVEFAEAEAQKMQSLHQLVSAAQAGQETLKTTADDAAALAAVGRWECFVNNKWAVGLPLLQKGNDAALAELASADLAKPTDVKAQGELAARWLQYGKSQREGAKRGPLSRAKFWYDQALPQAEGAPKAALEKSLTEVENLLKAEG